MSEYIVGFEVSRHDNVDVLPSVIWDELLDKISELDLIGPIDLLVLGKIYSTKDSVGGSTRHVGETEELYKVPNKSEDPSDATDTLAIVERYFKLDGTPQHIVGFVIRTFD